jgi:hypothetical protein
MRSWLTSADASHGMPDARVKAVITTSAIERMVHLIPHIRQMPAFADVCDSRKPW